MSRNLSRTVQKSISDWWMVKIHPEDSDISKQNPSTLPWTVRGVCRLHSWELSTGTGPIFWFCFPPTKTMGGGVPTVSCQNIHWSNSGKVRFQPFKTIYKSGSSRARLTACWLVSRNARGGVSLGQAAPWMKNWWIVGKTHIINNCQWGMAYNPQKYGDFLDTRWYTPRRNNINVESQGWDTPCHHSLTECMTKRPKWTCRFSRRMGDHVDFNSKFQVVFNPWTLRFHTFWYILCAFVARVYRWLHQVIVQFLFWTHPFLVSSSYTKFDSTSLWLMFQASGLQWWPCFGRPVRHGLFPTQRIQRC